MNKCGFLCLDCSRIDSNICNVCKSGVYQYNNACFHNCPISTYPDHEWQVCRPCHPDCPICWGPNPDMCGSKTGVSSSIVLIESEIKNYFDQRPFNNEELNSWMSKLNNILKKVKENKQNKVFGFIETSFFKEFENLADTISPEDVYQSNQIEIELPIGSFSRNNGVFIPIPSYLSTKLELVNSHWIFIEGNWDGHNWSNRWFPRLPSFLIYKGEKNKIYFENGGFWIYGDKGKIFFILGWSWVESKSLKDELIPIDLLLADLNTIKFDLGDLNTKNLERKIIMKKETIENNIRLFFEQFSQTNKLIFSKLINTVKNEENNLMNILENLRQKMKLFLGEDILLEESLRNRKAPIENFKNKQLNS